MVLDIRDHLFIIDITIHFLYYSCMIKHILVGTCVIGFITFVGVTVTNYAREDANTPPQTPSMPNVVEVTDLVNQERQRVGLAPLANDPRLDISAAAKCDDMVKYNYEAHVSPSGVSWESFFPQDLPPGTRISENLVEDGETSAKAVASWMGSPAHRDAILDPKYTHVGYAVCGPAKIFNNAVVQHFRGD